jgi:hypothetical protein
LIAGSSQASGPNRGIVINSPALFLIGFENLQSTSFPRTDSQAGLMIVKPVTAVNLCAQDAACSDLTFQVHARCLNKVLKDQEVWRGGIEKQ